MYVYQEGFINNKKYRVTIQARNSEIGQEGRTLSVYRIHKGKAVKIYEKLWAMESEEELWKDGWERAGSDEKNLRK